MTSDRPAGQPLVAPSSSNNLNPTAPVFCQGGQDKGSQNSFSADVSEKDFSKDFKDALNMGQPLANGDVHAATSGAGNYFGSSRGWANQSYQPRMHSHGGTQNPTVPMSLGHVQVVNAGQTNQNGPQPYSLMSAESMANTRQHSDGAGGEPSEGSSPEDGTGVENGGNEDGGGGGENDRETSEEEVQYPEEVLAPIRKQLEYYFSPENLPHDKFLNSHMDKQKFVPLRLFPDFNRMKLICHAIAQLVQAVQSSAVLELSEDKKSVRISQTRKTLTLRGLPPKATQEVIHQMLRENDCPRPHHIEVIMVHHVSNWYVSFSTEAQCMDAFFKLHNSKVIVDGYPIGCCIKSSGTHVATGYFPPQEEQQQRRMPQSQANVAAAVQGSITQQPAMQQPPALMQQYNHVQLHPSLMAPAAQGLYFSQGAHAQYMPYMPGMITQSWQGHTGLDPGLMLQSSGLQPQHIRTSTNLSRSMVQGAAQHRFTRPQRLGNRQNIDRSGVPQVSVSGSSPRNSPAGMDGPVPTNIVTHSASHMTRRSNLREDMNVTQHSASPHQFVTPIVTQHQVTGVPSTTAIVNPSVMEGVNNTVSLSHTAVNVPAHPMPQQAHQQQQQQSHNHPQSVLLQQTTMSANNAQTSNPLSQSHHQHHHHHHHHHQPPPQIPHQLAQPHQPQPQHNPHQNQQSHHHHHSHQHSIGNSHHVPQHIGSHQQQPPPPPLSATHQHQQSSMASAHQHTQPGHHPHHHHHPPHHHHHHHHQHHAMVQSQHQHHHQPPPNERRSLVMAPHQPPPQPHHHQQTAPLGNRRNRRRREETTNRNQRERNPGNRTNFSSQAPAAADNFTMEANSFPPLPGAANAPSSEITPENRTMHSDIVKGISRIPSLGSGAPLPVRGNSSTPSPVATPTLTPSHVPSAGPVIVDVQGGDDIDSVVDDDTTSSSQEEAEMDVGNVEPVSGANRQGRCDPPVPVSEGMSMPVQSRQIKGPIPVVPSNIGSNVRQGQNISQPKVQQQQQQAISFQQPTPTQQTNIPMSPGSSVASSEVPKLSYAQILKREEERNQKKREAANNAAAESANANVVTATSMTNSPVTSGSSAANNGSINNPASVQCMNQPNSGRMGQPSNNAFREQGNYPSHPGHRPVSHRSPKDNQPRTDGPQTRMPNGRRNSKENRTHGNAGKFDKKKPDGRPK